MINTALPLQDLQVKLFIFLSFGFALLLQTLDLLWEDFQKKLSDQVVNPLFTYQSKFPDVKVSLLRKS